MNPRQELCRLWMGWAAVGLVALPAAWFMNLTEATLRADEPAGVDKPVEQDAAAATASASAG